MTKIWLEDFCKDIKKKYNYDFVIKEALTTNSYYVRFFEDGLKMFTVRISDHRKPKSRISSVKPNPSKIQKKVKYKIKAYQASKVILMLK